MQSGNNYSMHEFKYQKIQHSNMKNSNIQVFTYARNRIYKNSSMWKINDATTKYVIFKYTIIKTRISNFSM